MAKGGRRFGRHMQCAVYSRGMRSVALNAFAALALAGKSVRGAEGGGTMSRGLWEAR